MVCSSMVFLLLSVTLNVITQTAYIGIATVVDFMRLDDAEVRANATIVEGALLQSALNPVQVTLTNGDRFELAPDSAGQVYHDRLLLKSGSAQLHTFSRYSIIADLLEVGVEGGSILRVRYQRHTVEISLVKGCAQVFRNNGLRLATVLPGSPRELVVQNSSASAASKLTGYVTRNRGRYYLTDSVSNLTAELRGASLDAASGKCVDANGSMVPNQIAPMSNGVVMRVVKWSAGKCLPQAALVAGVVVRPLNSQIEGPFSGGNPRKIGE